MGVLVPILLLAVILIVYVAKRNAPLAHIPGPFYTPIFGNFFALRSKQPGQQMLDWLEQYGMIYKYKFLWWERLCICDPDFIKHVLVTNEKNYTKNLVMYKMLAGIFGEEGLVVIRDVDHHRYLRNIISEVFKYQNLKLYFPIFTTMGKRLVSKLSSAAQSGVEVNIIDHLSACTLDVIGRAAFGLDLDAMKMTNGSGFEGNGERMREHLNRAFVALAGGILDFLPVLRDYTKNGRIRQSSAEQVDIEIEKVISRKKVTSEDIQNPERDLLDILVTLKDEEGQPLSVRSCADQCKTFLIAGHETSSGTLTWALFMLATHPDIDARLAAEVAAVLGTDATPTVELIEGMKYLNKVVKETLRMYPPAVALTRYTEQDDEVKGVRIPRGTQIQIPIYVLHHSPLFWDHPDEADPDRWDDGRREVNPYAYIPFLLGSRNCIGNRFALLEIKALLAMLVQRFRFRIPAGHAPVLRSSMPTLRPSPSLMLLIEPR